MLDPADCGPAFIALPQDVQAEAYDFPLRLFEPVVHEIASAAARRWTARRGDRRRAPVAAAADRRRGGVHYSLAEESLASFAERHGIPVVETVAGKSTLTHDHPYYAGPIGVIGAEGANRLAAEADVVLAVGTRLGDFATGSWSVFAEPGRRASSASTRRASTPTSTVARRSSATPGRRSSSSAPDSATGGAPARRGRLGSSARWPTLWAVSRRARRAGRRAARPTPRSSARSATGRPSTTTPSRRRVASPAS